MDDRRNPIVGLMDRYLNNLQDHQGFSAQKPIFPGEEEKPKLQVKQRLIVKIPVRKMKESSPAVDNPELKMMNQKQQQVRNQQQLASSPSVSNTNGGSTSCHVCGKSFVSMKSLFGHMRCHPEREWRGIQPPPSMVVKKTSPRSTGSDEDRIGSALTSESSDVNLIGSLPNWSHTGKRGKTNVDPQLSDKRVFHAVTGLLMLVHGDSPDFRRKKKQIVREIKDVEMNFSAGGAGLGGYEEKVSPSSVSSDPLRKRKREESDPNSDFPSKKLNVDDPRGNSRYGFDLDLVRSHYGLVSFNGSNENPEKLRESMELANMRRGYDVGSNPSQFNCEAARVEETGVVDYRSSNGFKCNTCNKIFPTHQALGGHKSSHRNCRHSESRDAANTSQVHQVQESDTRSKDATIHQCKTCGMSFLTGQALGGHQRRHWTGSVVIGAVPLNAEAPAQEKINVEVEGSTSSIAPAQEKFNVEVEGSTSSVAPSEEASTKQHKPLGFDLNELPVDMDDDELFSAHQSLVIYGASSQTLSTT